MMAGVVRHSHGHSEGVEWHRLSVPHGSFGEMVTPWPPVSQYHAAAPWLILATDTSIPHVSPGPSVQVPRGPQRQGLVFIVAHPLCLQPAWAHHSASATFPWALDTADPLLRSAAAQGHDVQTRADTTTDGSHTGGPGRRTGAIVGLPPICVPCRAGEGSREQPRHFLVLMPAGMLRPLLPCALPFAPAVPFSSSSYTLTPCRQWFWGSRVVLDRTLVSPVTLSFSTVISTEYMAGTQSTQRALQRPWPSPAPAASRRSAVRCGAVLSGVSEAAGSSRSGEWQRRVRHPGHSVPTGTCGAVAIPASPYLRFCIPCVRLSGR